MLISRLFSYPISHISCPALPGLFSALPGSRIFSSLLSPKLSAIFFRKSTARFRLAFGSLFPAVLVLVVIVSALLSRLFSLRTVSPGSSQLVSPVSYHISRPIPSSFSAHVSPVFSSSRPMCPGCFRLCCSCALPDCQVRLQSRYLAFCFFIFRICDSGDVPPVSYLTSLPYHVMSLPALVMSFPALPGSYLSPVPYLISLPGCSRLMSLFTALLPGCSRLISYIPGFFPSHIHFSSSRLILHIPGSPAPCHVHSRLISHLAYLPAPY